MAKKKSPVANPVTFELPLTLIEKIESVRAKRGLKSVSEVIRVALEEFNYSAFQVDRPEHRQISVRLPDTLKKALQKQAKAKKTSAGELLRAAIDQLPAAVKAAAKRR
jgi:Arc/MetJ-type ribon-helix-helix transcriptional regulator